MPQRRSSPGSWSSSRPLLALWAVCLWGCPQLLSDDFAVFRSPSDLGDDDPSVLDDGFGTSGSTGQSGSAESTNQPLPNAVGAGGTGPTPVSVPGVPTVVSVTPSNGASGVAANEVIMLTFSEPMNPSSVQTAYSSSDLPASSVSFSWSQGDTVLRITPNQPLTLATGSNPNTTIAKSYTFAIGTTALDSEGDALPRFSSSFSTLREIALTLDAVQDRLLTGNYRSDNVYGNNSCVQVGSPTTCIGDSSNDDSTYRGFVTFDLSGLPAQTKEFSSARLRMTIHTIRGTPFASLGSLLVERVSFASINLGAFSAAALGSAIDVSSNAGTGAQLSTDVLAFVQGDLPARNRSQFRFRFSTDTNTDLDGDLVETDWDTEKLELEYLIP